MLILLCSYWGTVKTRCSLDCHSHRHPSILVTGLNRINIGYCEYSIITETMHILVDSLDAFKHRVMMCKSLFYRTHFEYHKYHNCVYSDAG